MQALAVTLRGLALREIRIRHWLRVGAKELLTGAVNGVAGAVLTASASGYGKRTPVEEFPLQGRGGQGVIALQTSERNGAAVAALQVAPGQEIGRELTHRLAARTLGPVEPDRQPDHEAADLTFLEKIWPNVEAALRWMEVYGDIDGDGFVEYSRRSPNGLVHQGWKDSNDSIFHADGQLAEGPIAVCEVQAYVYAAKRAAAVVAAALGKPDLAQALKEQARDLQLRFEEAFWCEDLSTYALALDGDKKPCRVRASNAGYCLFTGIARRERARLVAHTLLGDDFFSGWGIRTVSSRENRYNPMSYHNGSIWPHDNALIARGFSRYGFRHEALKILTGLLDASVFLDLHRLPELFCGFPRRPGQGPTLYPVACSPQSWAAGAVLLILEACLGIRIQASPPRVLFRRTKLPAALPEVEIRNLKVGNATVDIGVERTEEGVYLRILRKAADVDIVSIK